MMKTKKRSYYGPQQGHSERSTHRIYLLRYQDLEDEQIKNEGPFANEDSAKDRLNSFLRKGICSWLVAYNE